MITKRRLIFVFWMNIIQLRSIDIRRSLAQHSSFNILRTSSIFRITSSLSIVFDKSALNHKIAIFLKISGVNVDKLWFDIKFATDLSNISMIICLRWLYTLLLTAIIQLATDNANVLRILLILLIFSIIFIKMSISDKIS